MSDQEFRAVFAEYRPLVWSVVCFHLRQPSQREDLFQEIWTEIFRSLGSFAGRAKRSTWIFSVARNTALRFAAQHRRREAGDTAADPPAPSPTPEQILLSREALQSGLKRLSSEEAEVVFFRYVYDYPYEELAAVLGIPVTTVKSRLFEARKKLRESLAPPASASSTK